MTIKQAAGSRQQAAKTTSRALCLYCLLPAACCLLPAAYAAEPAAAAVFVLHSTADAQPAGALTKLDAASVQVAGTAALPLADLVALRRKDLPPPHFPHDRPNVALANGDRIPGRAVSI